MARRRSPEVRTGASSVVAADGVTEGVVEGVAEGVAEAVALGVAFGELDGVADAVGVAEAQGRAEALGDAVGEAVVDVVVDVVVAVLAEADGDGLAVGQAGTIGEATTPETSPVQYDVRFSAPAQEKLTCTWSVCGLAPT